MCFCVVFNKLNRPKGNQQPPSILWLLSHVMQFCKASVGMEGEEEQGEDNKGSVKKGGGGYSRAAARYIPLCLQAAE